jgi:predicted dienelactone hydrolase
MKLLLKVLGGMIAVLIVVVAGLVIFLLATAVRPTRPIGVEQALAPDPGHAPVTVTIFYPTNGAPQRVWMGTRFVLLRPHAAVAPGRHPMVIISHGTGGAPTSHLDTALALAQAGYVVVAPLHNGDNYQENTRVGTSDWIVDRARHIARVADYMLTRWRDRDRIDARRVGMFGFSAGGTTALVAIGGTPDLSRVAPHCARNPEFVCQLLKPGAPLRVPAASEWATTPAIRAAVIVAPGLGFTFAPHGLSRVTAAVQLWDGTADASVPLATNAGIVRGLLPMSPEFHLVPNAAHFSFLAPCGAMAPLLPPMLCSDPAGFDRTAFHQQFNARIVAFFDRTLIPR